MLGAFIIARRNSIVNRIHKVIVIRQQLIYALLGLFIFARRNIITNRINGGIVSFRLKFVLSRTSLDHKIVVLSDVILQMIKKVLVGHLFLFVRRQRSIREITFGIIIADFVIIADVYTINDLSGVGVGVVGVGVYH